MPLGCFTYCDNGCYGLMRYIFLAPVHHVVLRLGQGLT